MDATVSPFAVELAAPLSTAAGDIERREGLVVRVSDDDAVGWGEATPLPGWTEPLDSCREVLSEAVGTLARDGPDAALADLAGAPAARHGLSLALADLYARRAGDPLWRHLADEAPEADVDSVPVNAVVGDGSARETVDAAAAAVDEGFDCVKVKCGARSVDEDTTRVQRVRAAVGEDVALRADSNGAWTRVQAYEAFRTLAAAGVDYVEQPLTADDLAGLAGLGGRGVDVAVDETLAQTPVSAVLDAGAADLVVCKPQVLGGVDRAVDAARRAREAGLRAVVTTTVDAVVARTGAVHCAAALSATGPLPACGLATADRLDTDLAADPAPVADGDIAVPDGPGIGVEGVSR